MEIVGAQKKAGPVVRHEFKPPLYHRFQCDFGQVTVYVTSRSVKWGCGDKYIKVRGAQLFRGISTSDRQVWAEFGLVSRRNSFTLSGERNTTIYWVGGRRGYF